MYRFEGLYFRALEEKDLEPLRRMRNDPSTWTRLTDITFIDPEAQKKWYRGLHRDTHHRRYFAVGSARSRFLGIVRMDEIDLINRSARVGCDVVPAYRGRGLGTSIMKGVVRYCFDVMNLHRAWLAVLDSNK